MRFSVMSNELAVETVATLRVVVADDHPLFREALKEVLVALHPRVECVEIANYPDLLKLVRAEHDGFGLIFVDLLMPGSDDLGALQALRAAAPGTPTVVISAREDTATIRRVLACGVAGYISKATPKAELEAAITLILNGETYIPRQLDVNAGNDAVIPANQLTRRQSAVLEQLACGRSN